MTETIQNALILIAVLGAAISILLARRGSRSGHSALEERIGQVETEIEKMQRAFADQSARQIEEINQKTKQVKEDLKNTLAPSLESFLKKVAANETSLKGRIDSLDGKVAANETSLMGRIDSLDGKILKLQETMQQEAEKSSRQETPPPAEPVVNQAPPAPKPREGAGEDPASKAKRLARLIVSDIALYNKKNIEEGVRNGNFEELLAHDIREARSLYARRVPEEIRNNTSFLDEAFAELIEKTKKDLSTK